MKIDLLQRLGEFRPSWRWQGQGGYREVLKLAAPLIVSMGALSLQEFIDRMFLSWYSSESIAAALPAGILSFTLLSFFMGIAGYVGTFVAQYFGADRYEKIGPSIWQGLYIALIGAVLMLALIPLAPALFRFFAHPEAVQKLEVIYFRILCYGAFFVIANSALSCFFSGRGKSAPVMWVHLAATGLNIIMNYMLIFGNWGFPEMGIAGAAISTVCSGAFASLLFFILMVRPAFNRVYKTVSGWRPDRELFSRLLKFGLPAGIQFFIEVFGFTVFVLVVGRLGMVQLAATNVAFNISSIAFMPMIGLGIAVSVLVGQYLGQERVPLAERSVRSAAVISFFYIGCVVLLYLLIPRTLINIFAPRDDPASFKPIADIGVNLLRFIIVFSLFDNLFIIFGSSLKGAGDTRFVMLMVLIVSTVVLALPSYLALVVFGADIYIAWVIVSVYIMVNALAVFIRYRGGKWKSMRVI